MFNHITTHLGLEYAVVISTLLTWLCILLDSNLYTFISLPTYLIILYVPERNINVKLP